MRYSHFRFQTKELSRRINFEFSIRWAAGFDSTIRNWFQVWRNSASNINKQIERI